MQLSVLIPTYNDGAILPETLAPLLADEATGEIVVVVDGAHDGAFEMLREMASHDGRVRPFWIENRGRPGARQYALEQARNDVVLMMDADVIAEPGLVSRHAAWHVDGVPRLVVGYMPPRIPPRRRESFIVERYANLYERACREFEADPAELFLHLWGGNVSVPRTSLIEIGGVDGGVGVRYMDDVELGLRLGRTDLAPVFDRSLRAEHRFEKSTDGYFRTARQYGHDVILLDGLYPGKIRVPNWGTSGKGATLRRFTRRPRAHLLVKALGRPAMAAAGLLRLWAAEEFIAVALDFVEVQQGMMEARRRR